DWMKAFASLLQFKNNNLNPSNNDEPGVIDNIHSLICETVNLYATKYEDQFKSYIQVFVNEIWKLLSDNVTPSKRYDNLVNAAIKFLTSIVKKSQYTQLFSNEQALKTISERVIIPQLKLRDNELELFSDDPHEYIRIDIEGSDVDTRRR